MPVLASIHRDSQHFYCTFQKVNNTNLDQPDQNHAGPEKWSAIKMPMMCNGVLMNIRHHLLYFGHFFWHPWYWYLDIYTLLKQQTPECLSSFSDFKSATQCRMTINSVRATLMNSHSLCPCRLADRPYPLLAMWTSLGTSDHHVNALKHTHAQAYSNIHKHTNIPTQPPNTKYRMVTGRPLTSPFHRLRK